MTNSQDRSVVGKAASRSSRSPDDAVYAGLERRRVPRPLPVPEVLESDDGDAWALWHESVSQLDSELPTEPAPLEGFPQRNDTGTGAGRSADTADIDDPFASVHRRSR